MTRSTRREWLAASAWAGLSFSAIAAEEKPASPDDKREGALSAKLAGTRIDVSLGSSLLTTYRADPSQKYPYLCPMIGPASGLSLTVDKTEPYPHHSSVFFGCDRVNGGNYWQEGNDRGQIVSLGPKLGESTAGRIEITDHCQWRQPGKPPIMRDRRRIRIQPLPGRARLFDVAITWTAVESVTIEKTNHALFSMRAAPDLCPNGGGTLLSSEGGRGEKATFGTPARWCAFYGRRAKSPGGDVEGIALFHHPSNPWKNCPWFTRDYGFASPSPFFWLAQPWKLPAGKSVELRYAVLLFAGPANDGRVERCYQAWTKELGLNS